MFKRDIGQYDELSVGSFPSVIIGEFHMPGQFPVCRLYKGWEGLDYISELYKIHYFTL